jgi:ATP-dependent Clp protease ATP-binding subunit ClpB
VVFERLSEKLMGAIVDVQLQKVVKHLKQSKNITLDVGEDFRSYLAEVGYDPAFGARPLKRLIQTALLDPLALEIIEGKVKDGQTVRVSLKNNTPQFS